MVVNILEELRIRLDHNIDLCGDREIEVWNDYFLTLKEKNEELYDAYLKLMVSDTYEILKFLEIKEGLEEEELELIDQIENYEDWNAILVEIETNAVFFESVLEGFLRKQEYREGFLIACFNHTLNHHSATMKKINPFYIYETIYASLLGFTHRPKYNRQDFLRIYEYLGNKYEVGQNDDEYEIFMNALMFTDYQLYIHALSDMIESFYIYSTLEKNDGVLNDDMLEIEMYNKIEHGEFQSVVAYFNNDSVAFQKLAMYFYIHNEFNQKENMRDFVHLKDHSGYSRVLKMLNKNKEGLD